MKGCSEDLAMLYFQALSPVSKIKQEDDRISVLWVAESVEETYCDYFYIRGDSVVHFDWSLARGMDEPM